jgi:glycosyltransferase involved in cell wall biosynthesis
MNGIPKDNGKVGVSGGDVRVMQIAKNLKGYQVNFLTTPNGEKILNMYGLKNIKKYILKGNNSSGILPNIKITIKSIFYLPEELKIYHGMAYSSCEHLYDVLPALRLKLLNNCEWFAVYHWVEDYPWREKRGGTPFLSRYLYWFNRYISGLLIKSFSNHILAVSEQTKKKLINIKKIDAKRIKSVNCGVEYEKIIAVVNKYKNEKGKKYDAVYMKRLNYGKGIIDLLEIWKKVSIINKNTKLAIIGQGSREVMRKIDQFIKNNKLQKNIMLLGYVYKFEEKIRIVNSAKLFILPSYEENWAIVIGEAMTAKIPVLAYELKEIKPIWKDNVDWIKIGDTDEFSEKILHALRDKSYNSVKVNRAFNFMKNFDWNQIAEKEL